MALVQPLILSFFLALSNQHLMRSYLLFLILFRAQFFLWFLSRLTPNHKFLLITSGFMTRKTFQRLLFYYPTFHGTLFIRLMTQKIPGQIFKETFQRVMLKCIPSEIVLPSSHSTPPWITCSLVSSINPKSTCIILLNPLVLPNFGQLIIVNEVIPSLYFAL